MVTLLSFPCPSSPRYSTFLLSPNKFVLFVILMTLLFTLVNRVDYKEAINRYTRKYTCRTGFRTLPNTCKNKFANNLFNSIRKSALTMTSNIYDYLFACSWIRIRLSSPFFCHSLRYKGLSVWSCKVIIRCPIEKASIFFDYGDNQIGIYENTLIVVHIFVHVLC